MVSPLDHTGEELFLRRRRRRSIALALVLAALVLLFYVLTFVKMSIYHQL